MVVLPAPLCPSKAVICPLYMFKFKLSTAFLLTDSLVEMRLTNLRKMDCTGREGEEGGREGWRGEGGGRDGGGGEGGREGGREGEYFKLIQNSTYL